MTDVGKKRKNNQDSIFVSPDNKFFVLADGMGGHLGGEEASRLATDIASDVFLNPSALRKFDTLDELTLRDMAGDKRTTRVAIIEADREISKVSRERQDLKGMGATIETLYINPKSGLATIGHVGDSRVYRLRDGEFALLTEDHSLLNEEMKRREMTQEEIENFPFKNRIVRALGHLADRRIDIFDEKVEAGDVYLMCSDGLTDVTDDGEIRDMLEDNRDDPKKACQLLVDVANERGGPDNISVIIAIVE